uniref:Uncharacterized protein n=1 Tax=Anguilla anguilla TaxID=7936 RepID=A0A0E9TEL4_ANGAN
MIFLPEPSLNSCPQSCL